MTVIKFQPKTKKEKFIGYNLKIARLSLRLSVKDLSSTLKVNKQSIYNYENNKRCPSFILITRLCIILDKPYLYFFKKLDNRFTKDNSFLFMCYDINYHFNKK